MTLFVPTIGYLCVLVVTTLATSNWNQEMRDYIMDIHNEKRRGEGGCQMNKLVYDMELEAQARQWAENCVFKHEMKEGRGENLAWDSNQNPEKELILGSSGRWFNETYEYSYGQYSCGPSCHYTQRCDQRSIHLYAKVTESDGQLSETDGRVTETHGQMTITDGQVTSDGQVT